MSSDVALRAAPRDRLLGELLLDGGPRSASVQALANRAYSF